VGIKTGSPQGALDAADGRPVHGRPREVAPHRPFADVGKLGNCGDLRWIEGVLRGPGHTEHCPRRAGGVKGE
jgi:hypothetical protein